MTAWAFRLRASLQALPPSQVALLLSVGLVLGVFPIMGCPTILCLLAAGGLRLNIAALQLLNNISSQLQFALLLPLARAGAWICRGAAAPGASLASNLGTGALHAVVGWTCICIPLGLVLYFTLVVVMRIGRTMCFNSVKSPA
uniref:DUF2062 domain-containing protein n=1 Tax=Solibacter usitatus (strain Ellin6076) TaxID=234267 RepID=Q023T5_SOLUE